MAETLPYKARYWVRLTQADGTQTLWCVNTGRARALSIYRRERRKAVLGDEVEWGEGEGTVRAG
jgi:hypothetical protein